MRLLVVYTGLKMCTQSQCGQDQGNGLILDAGINRAYDREVTSCPVQYLMHGIHELGEMIEALRGGHHASLLQMDSLGQLPNVVLSHLLKLGLAL